MTGPPPQLSRYVQFIYEFLEAREQVDPGQVGRELGDFKKTLQSQLFEMVDVVSKLDADIASQREGVGYERAKICLNWGIFTFAQRQASLNQITGAWQNVEKAHGNRIRILNECLTHTSGERRDILEPSIRKRLEVANNDLRAFLQYKDRLGDLSLNPIQRYKQWKPAQKVWPLPDTDEYKLCQKQVLPPYPTKKSESPTAATFNKARDLFRFQKGRRNGISWKAQTLAGGAQGQTWAYTLTDANETIINRVVRKETTPPETLEDWVCPYSWHGDTSDPNFRSECVPLEFHTQDLVSRAKDSHAVKLLAPPVVFWEDWKYRLYMQYAPHGDCDNSIGLHDDFEEPVPEAFLWLVLQALATTALIMEQEDTKKKVEEWSEIVHCDFKAANVFLGLPNGKYYKQYPTVKLGDFGLAFPTNDKDATNPIWRSERGTEGHFAPEQLHYVDSITKQPWGNTQKILSSANIYGLATIIYQMMERLQNIGEQPTWESTEPLPPGAIAKNPEFKISAATRKLYNDSRLIDLVERCLSSRPEDRPSAWELVQVCQARLRHRDKKRERDGEVDEMGDTLILSRDAVDLRWVSRLGGRGVDEGGRRIARGAGGETGEETGEDEEDEEMED